MTIVNNIQTHFKIFGILYMIIQSICIYLIVVKKINTNKIKKIVKILSTSSIIIAMLFVFEAIYLTYFNKYLKLIGFIMMIFSGFMKGIIKKLNNE